MSEINDIAPILSSVAAIILAGIALYKAFKQTPSETNGVRANTVKVFEEAAKMAGERLIAIEKQLTSVREERDALVAKNEEICSRIDALEKERTELNKWIERLKFQIRSLGAEPVERVPGKKPVATSNT